MLTASSRLREQRLKGVFLKETEVDIKGTKVTMVSCHNTTDEMYHVTSIANLRAIAGSGFLRPVPGGVGFSASVSISSNPQHTYGKGNVKIVFHKHAIIHLLRPMLYYESDEIQRKHGISVSDHEEEIQTELKKELRIPCISIDEVRTRIGMTNRIYVEECEWLTERTVPFDKSTVKMVVYMIPQHPDDPNNVMSCIHSNEHYAYPRSEYSFGVFELLETINKVRRFVEGRGLEFGVDSCFPRVEFRRSGEVIRLTPGNLNHLAAGEMPDVETSPSTGGDEKDCKC